jgi:hypothetical protein
MVYDEPHVNIPKKVSEVIPFAKIMKQMEEKIALDMQVGTKSNTMH